MASIKKKSSGGGGANWMDTYGDMVTLLLCFFVLLYSISSIDQNKWMLVVQSFNKDAMQNITDTPIGPAGETGDEGGDDLPATSMDKAFAELFDYLQTQAAASDSISVSKGDGYVFISFSDAVFFDGDKSYLRPDGRAVLDSIIPALNQAGAYIDEIRVLGHTAQANPNHPNTIRGDRTLAGNRATEVLIYLMEHCDQKQLDPASFVAMAYGQWRPIASNEDESTRYKNRRVEMIITGREIEDKLDGGIRQYYTETGQKQPAAAGETPTGGT